MPRIARKGLLQKTLPRGGLFRLLTGSDFFNDGFGRADAFDEKAARLAWNDAAVRAKVYAMAAERKRIDPPWAEIEFGIK